MTAEKVKAVVDRYDVRLADWEARAADASKPLRSKDWPELVAVRHVKAMLPQVRRFADEGRLEKAFRWLGFIQGVLWMTGSYTIDEMRDHNKP